MTRKVILAGLAGVLAVGISCSDSSTGPGQLREEDSLTFLSPAPDLPPFPVTTVSFFAVRDENREVRLFYAKRPGDLDSTEFVRFEIPGGALTSGPNGAPLVGDSILITLTISDPSRLIVSFEPAGLRFARPARLRIKYAEADDDFNHDGSVDSEDSSDEDEFFIWRQEQVGQPWVRLGSVRVKDQKEVEAEIDGFTNFAIAF
ncbi:MAG TPA: hypothetical protein VFK13_10660 [Gemmatimonadaceae bacterium]|nr:hypothetical protein [Gemmatimonadaceae bacterium]